ncbi:DoxX family protein [Solimicrobium silvestre]|uniref:Putative membrane protein n=1 Tax=Solimicrobium silvestre TaxID=2099400 RepID=A0A2S9GXQ8_9BURK|nr:DoxX family protein [Solimicrobium silvestre]PRC92490.1 putative membrane protein [Solimicrobium silvestre]
MLTIDRNKNALIFLRILISCLIAVHGWHRLIYSDPADLGGAITDFGFPVGLALGWLITLVEAFGAPLFAMGWLVFPLGVFYTFVYVMAIIFYHAPHGWFSSGSGADGCEYAVLLVGGLLCVSTQHVPTWITVRGLKFWQRA